MTGEGDGAAGGTGEAGGRGGGSLPGAMGDPDPFAGFEVSVIVDRAVYAPDEMVRMTVSAINDRARFVEHRYPGWQRFVLRVVDEYHRTVADTEVARTAEEDAVDRWLPGQMLVFPVYWPQHEGPVVPAWSSQPVGPRVAPGRYRARVTWLGREAGSRAEPPEAFSPYFELR